MQKLLYTEEGLQIMKSKSSDSPLKQSSLSLEPSARLSQMRVSSLSKQCNKMRVGTLKNTFNLSTPENLIQVLPFTKLQHKITQIPQVLTVETIPKPQTDLLSLACSQLHINSPASAHSISRHHQYSLRLRTGDWYQWKNLSLYPEIVEDFQKKLKLIEPSDDELRMKQEKKQVQHMFEMAKVQQVAKKTEDNLNQLLEQKGQTYNIELDQFWKQMKENTRYFQSHSRDINKQRVSQLERLGKCKKKFAVKRCYIPQYQKIQVKDTNYYEV